MRKKIIIIATLLALPLGALLYLNQSRVDVMQSLVEAKTYFQEVVSPLNMASSESTKLPFEDAKFRSCISEAYQKEQESTLDWSAYEEKLKTYNESGREGAVPELDEDLTRELAKIKSLSCMSKITETDYYYDVTGINYLTNLVKLELNVRLQSVDLSSNTNLESLRISSTKKVGVDGPYSIIADTIDLSHNLKLKSIYLFNQEIKYLDLSKHKELTNISLNNNKLETVTLPECAGEECSNLATLDLGNNSLSGELDLTSYTNLTNVNITNNQYTGLKLPLNGESNTTLKELMAGSNKLGSIDVSKYPSLERLGLESNGLKELDLSNLKHLQLLLLNDNDIDHLDLTGKRDLKLLIIENNVFKDNTNTIYLYKDAEREIAKSTLSADNVLKLPITHTCTTESDCNDIQRVATFDNAKSLNSELKLTENGSNLTLVASKTGDYDIEASYHHDIVYRPFFLRNTFAVRFHVKVIELSSTDPNYLIDSEDNYIYTGKDVTKDAISSKLTLDAESLTIEVDDDATSVKVKHGESVIKEYAIINYSSDVYDLSKEYNVIGTSPYDASKVTYTNKDGVSLDDLNGTLTLKFHNDVLAQTKLVGYSLTGYPKYENEDYIYIGVEAFDSDKVTLLNASIEEVKDGEVLTEVKIKYNTDVLKTYKILSIDLGTLPHEDKQIDAQNAAHTYEDFISNITLHGDGLSYKILNGEEEVTSGRITNGMTLKIMYQDEEVDSFEVVNAYHEYLTFSEDLKFDEENKYIVDINAGNSVFYLTYRVSTSGKVKIVAKDGNTKVILNLLATGDKLVVEGLLKEVSYTIIVKGDINGDGKVNISDARMSVMHSLKKDYITDAASRRAADIDGNGFTMGDARKIVMYTLKGGEL